MRELAAFAGFVGTLFGLYFTGGLPAMGVFVGWMVFVVVFANMDRTPE
jgi:hypothetical protein